MAKNVPNVKVKVDKQEEFVASEVCLFQLAKGDKFLPGLIALTGQEILIFNDYAPSEKVGDLYVYNPVFNFEFKSVKGVEVTNLNGNKELQNYVGMTIKEANSGNQVILFFHKRKARHFKKVCKAIKKVAKIKIKRRENDCSIYN